MSTTEVKNQSWRKRDTNWIAKSMKYNKETGRSSQDDELERRHREDQTFKKLQKDIFKKLTKKSKRSIRKRLLSFFIRLWSKSRIVRFCIPFIQQQETGCKGNSQEDRFKSSLKKKKDRMYEDHGKRWLKRQEKVDKSSLRSFRSLSLQDFRTSRIHLLPFLTRSYSSSFSVVIMTTERQTSM